MPIPTAKKLSASSAVSMRRRSRRSCHQLERAVTTVRIAGTRVSSVSTLEKSRVRQTRQ